MKNISNLTLIAVLITTAFSLNGCNDNTSHSITEIDQSTLCEVDDWGLDITSQCKVGQKIAFLPNQWGNEQLPLKFVAVNCDLKYTISMTNGGVICIYKPITPTKKSKS